MVGVTLAVSFLLAVTSTLYSVGFRQQRTGRRYSLAQTDGRAALARVTRTRRHGSKVVGTSNAGTLSGLTSSASQLIVNIPQATGNSPIDVMYAIDNAGNLYYKGQNDANGTTLTYGVQSMTVH